jgi:hypothetical protein
VRCVCAVIEVTARMQAPVQPEGPYLAFQPRRGVFAQASWARTRGMGAWSRSDPGVQPGLTVRLLAGGGLSAVARKFDDVSGRRAGSLSTASTRQSGAATERCLSSRGGASPSAVCAPSFAQEQARRRPETRHMLRTTSALMEDRRQLPLPAQRPPCERGPRADKRRQRPPRTT